MKKNRQKKEMFKKASNEIIKNNKKGLDTIVIQTPNNISLFPLKETPKNK